MMKVLYIANVRIPTERAHGIQIMNTCEALAKQGAIIELVVPKRKNEIKTDPFEYYGVEKVFTIKYLWCLDLISWGRVGFWIETITFAKMVAIFALFKNDRFHTRESFLSFMLKILGKKVTWESHEGHQNVLTKIFIKLGGRMVVITKSLKDLYVSLGVKDESILVAPDAVDIGKFNIPETKAEARTKLGMDQDKQIVMYVGSMQSWKGVDTLQEAEKMLPEEVQVLFITNKRHEDIPMYLRTADILVLPNSAKSDVSKFYTSPMKLFEYMASGAPILASDLPSIREVLNESNATFFTPDDVTSLASTIKGMLADYSGATERALKAFDDVNEYSWENRAKNMLDFINR